MTERVSFVVLDIGLKIMMPAPRGARENELHNYLATMLNIYGIGILLLAPLLAKVLRQARASLIFFLPYVVQILFHNSGPFYNDNVIWFVIAAIAAASYGSEARLDGSAGQRVRGSLQRLHPRHMSFGQVLAPFQLGLWTSSREGTPQLCERILSRRLGGFSV